MLAKKILYSAKDLLLIIFLIGLSLIILLFPEYSSNGAKNGIISCVDILFPSLFPFMVISNFFVKSSLSLKLGKFMNPITKFLFGLPGYTGPTILMGLIGGYPTSARGIKSLYEEKKLNKTQAEQMIFFTVNAGPAFVMSVVGNKFLKNEKAGLILLISQILSSVFLGIIIKFMFKTSDECKKNKDTIKPQNNNLFSAFISSCTDAFYGLINLSSLVIIFSVIINLFNSIGISKLFCNLFVNIGIPEKFANSILPIFFEVTSGCMISATVKAPLEFISFALGWAGICVHFQVLSSLGKIKISALKFAFFRLLHAALSCFVSYTLLKFASIDLEVISNTSKQLAFSTYSNYSNCVILILLSILFIANITKQPMDLTSQK